MKIFENTLSYRWMAAISKSVMYSAPLIAILYYFILRDSFLAINSTDGDRSDAGRVLFKIGISTILVLPSVLSNTFLKMPKRILVGEEKTKVEYWRKEKEFENRDLEGYEIRPVLFGSEVVRLKFRNENYMEAEGGYRETLQLEKILEKNRCEPVAGGDAAR